MGIITKENEGTRVWFTLEKSDKSMYFAEEPVYSSDKKSNLTENDIQLISNELEQLRKTQVHEISEILRILNSESFGQNEKLRELGKMIESAAFSSDGKLYKKLIYPEK
jgi:uncharacterized protein YfkK (UPF0435 family)